MLARASQTIENQLITGNSLECQSYLSLIYVA